MKYDLKCEVTKIEPGMTIRGALRKEKGVSTRLIRKMIHGGGTVVLNGSLARFNSPVQAGDVIGLVYPREESGFPPQDIPIAVLYEDDHILAVDKQPGVVVHPTKGHPDQTIANGLMKYMAETGQTFRVRFINRLDRDTSGLLLVGKNARAQSDFARQSEKGAIEKIYLALVEGLVPEEEGVVDLPIALKAENGPERTVRADGYPSVTRYRTLIRFAEGCSLLEVKLETGRTHQIRVHLSHMGHPVVGDTLYGVGGTKGMARQALHAYCLRFRHPVTEEHLCFRSPLPTDMADCMEGLGQEALWENIDILRRGGDHETN